MTLQTEIMTPIIPAIHDDDDFDAGVRRHLWTRTELYRALELGLFPSTLRLELIEGELIEKMTQNRPHMRTLSKSARVLEAAFGSGFHCLQQSPLNVSEANDPEPDLMIVVGTPDDYEDHPTPADVRLIVEISDTTARYDRKTKGPVYARSRIEEYWMLVLKTRTLEVRRDPDLLPNSPNGYGYKARKIYTEADTVTPLYALHASIRVADLFPQLKIATSQTVNEPQSQD